MMVISRRELFISSGSVLIGLLAQKILFAQSIAATHSLKVNLIKEFCKKQVLDISPDGLSLCFENWGDAGYPLEVVEIGTGRMVYSATFGTRVRHASFFKDSKSLLVDTPIAIKGKNAHHLTVVELYLGKRYEGLDSASNPYRNDYAEALSDKMLLVTDIDWSSIERSTIALVEFPNYREAKRASFVLKSDKQELSTPGNSRFGLSDDRGIFVYSYGRKLVCRRNNDLEVLWTREPEPMLRAFNIISPNRNYVAVAFADNAFREQQKDSLISIYNGMTGADIARLPICGTDGFALSPDGSLLAAVEVVNYRKKKMYFTNIHIYDVKSGNILASFEHDRIKWQHAGTIKAACLVYFTADGQYLISSGMNTKVWKLGINED